jgi:regulator of extracellular matrix RemA (YlzA/DUF370 family)|nr:MAG TPA: protein of unknown function (DUF370) [Caudoviricetes sp.]
MFVNVGTNSFVKVDEIETISPPESSPVKRLLNNAKDTNACVELNYGKRVKSVIVLKTGHIVTSALLPQTIATRIAEKNCENAK